MKYDKKKIFEEIRVLFTLVVVAFTVKATLVEIYVVPTGSMENEILVGDMLIGNKFVYGMRTPTWIGLPYTRIGFDIPWLRLPEFKSVKNGDVTLSVEVILSTPSTFDSGYPDTICISLFS